MNECPYCQKKDRQVKARRTGAGSQRYKCQYCQGRYTPEPKESGYGDELRQQAVRLYLDGMNFRRIGRHLGVHHQTVTGSMPMCQLCPISRPSQVKLRWWNRMSCLPASGTKKRSLRHDHC